jgi:tetratricopeptide (TPR) repeat protein
MPSWTPCPFTGVFQHTRDSVTLQWTRLHAGDAEPLPTDAALMDAWVLYHNGAFEDAALAALALGPSGLTLANKAACIHATYVEPSEPARLERLLSAAERAQQQQGLAPDLPGAWYWQGYALGRYSQGVSVARALARGLGSTVRHALDTTITLAPHHADAHLALASFHAEVIDKVGELIGNLVHGARKGAALALYEKALLLNPRSAVTLHEFANGLLMLEGERGLERATQLREQAEAFEPLDAMEQLYLTAARADLDG